MAGPVLNRLRYENSGRKKFYFEVLQITENLTDPPSKGNITEKRLSFERFSFTPSKSRLINLKTLYLQAKPGIIAGLLVFSCIDLKNSGMVSRNLSYAAPSLLAVLAVLMFRGSEAAS